MHPELQAEIQFGLDNSGAGSPADLLELIRKFLHQSSEWKPADEAVAPSGKERCVRRSRRD